MGSGARAATAEHRRLTADREAWTAWGPYLAERAWGTVREDYSADGDAWSYFPHDDARRRTFRWNEDGLAGFSDRRQRWCLAFAFWNGRDPYLKERLFGLSGPEGNHGEDAKEEWWYLDATPTHSWGSLAYAYPQQAYPYEELRRENARRGYADTEYELRDTGAFDRGWWDIVVDHAKAAADDLCVRVVATNEGPDPDELHIVPTFWFRNRWRWGGGTDPIPAVRLAGPGALEMEETRTGRLYLTAAGEPTPLFCDNETNAEALWGGRNRTPFTKDGIGEHIVAGAASINPDRQGTKAGWWYRERVAPGESVEIRIRLAPEARSVEAEFEAIVEQRRQEADEFYAHVLAGIESDDERRITRQALAGTLFSKQWYHFDVERWLTGDPAFAAPPASRKKGRNRDWTHLNNAAVIPMPDPWEYPWYAAWDTAFHCLPLALVDPEYAKSQLRLLGREWYQHPSGQLPAYEWDFGDVNPPVHAWAGLRVFELDGGTDDAFLERLLHKLLLNFGWWVNRRDPDGNNLFGGGFLGLDNIGPFDRSDGIPMGVLEQSDATAWMAMYTLDLLDMSVRLAHGRPSYEDLAVKFAQHFALISTAMHNDLMWSDTDGFYYDVLRVSGKPTTLRVRSMVGLIPVFATRVVPRASLDELPEFAARLEWFRRNKPELSQHLHQNDDGDLLLSIVSPDRLRRLLDRMLDEAEFLSPYGVRSLSKHHEAHPYSLTVGGERYAVGYEPGESRSGLFGGNSNWRGPVWFPVNYLLIESLLRFDRWSGGALTVEYPRGSGTQVAVGEIAEILAGRLRALFLAGPDGERPSMPRHPLYAPGGPWHDRLLFHEYFDGETGRGLGAGHQTGWTALVALLTTATMEPFGRRRWARA